MPLPDPIWSNFTQLGYVAGFKQKRSKCNTKSIIHLELRMHILKIVLI
jgi:hypothetical protein